jgi:hypothetical protein
MTAGGLTLVGEPEFDDRENEFLTLAASYFFKNAVCSAFEFLGFVILTIDFR